MIFVTAMGVKNYTILPLKNSIQPIDVKSLIGSNFDFEAIGLFHSISIQGVNELFQGYSEKNFQGLLGRFSDISWGFCLKLFFFQGFRRPSIVHLYFFFPEGRIIILVICKGSNIISECPGGKKDFPGVGMLFRSFQGVKD